MHADDGFDRARQRVETHYFHCASPCALDVPAGASDDLACSTAFAHLPWRQTVEARGRGVANVTRRAEVERPAGRLRQLVQRRPARAHELRRPLPEHDARTLLRQARAEDLDVVYNLIVNKEERIPDIG